MSFNFFLPYCLLAVASFPAFRIASAIASLYAIEGGFICSPRRQPTFSDATAGFRAKWRLRNERRNSILMTRHYPDLGNASDWSCCVANLFQPILYLFLCRSVGVKLSLLLAEQRHKRALEVIGVLYRSQFFLWRKEQLYMSLIAVVCTITSCDRLNWTELLVPLLTS